MLVLYYYEQLSLNNDTGRAGKSFEKIPSTKMGVVSKFYAFITTVAHVNTFVQLQFFTAVVHKKDVLFYTDACRLHSRGLGFREKDREKTARERLQIIDEYCKVCQHACLIPFQESANIKS